MPRKTKNVTTATSNLKEPPSVVMYVGAAPEPAPQPGKPRAWQQAALSALADQRLRALIAPTGSGKSWLIKQLALAELKASPALRVIVAIPQWIIESSFQPEDNWPVLVAKKNGTAKMIEAFVRGKRFDVPKGEKQPRVLLCTHQALVAAEARGSIDWSGVSLYVDEAHHSYSATAESRNRIGALVQRFIASPTARLTLVTATFYRAAVESIVSMESWNAAPPIGFKKFVYAIGEYLASMTHLKEIAFNFSVGDAEEALRRAGKKRATQTSCYLPAVQTRHAKLASFAHDERGGKYALLAAYRKAYGRDGIDLVTDDEAREERMAGLCASIGASSPPRLVWALGMAKEGFDWPSLERVIVVGERGSLPETMQIFGRLLRDHEKKRRVEFHHIFPCTTEQADEPEIMKAVLNSMFMAMSVSWALERAGVRRERSEPAKLSARRADGEIAQEMSDADFARVTEQAENAISPTLKREIMAIFTDPDGVVDLVAMKAATGSALREYCALYAIGDFKAWVAKFGEKKPDLTVEQIRAWMEEHKARTGKWPHVNSGLVAGQSATWRAIECALVQGLRGLPCGLSLAKLHRLPDLTIAAILDGAIVYAMGNGGTLPSGKSSEGGVLGHSWYAIDRRLRSGAYGLPGGSSLCAELRVLVAQGFTSAKRAADVRPEVRVKRAAHLLTPEMKTKARDAAKIASARPAVKAARRANIAVVSNSVNRLPALRAAMALRRRPGSVARAR